MKQSLNELSNFSIEAKDGLKGNVKDFLFDEERWVIRYLEADLGLIFSGKKVLISKMFLKKPEWKNFHFPVELDKSDIEKCPGLEENLPVSRKYEEELNKSYDLVNYWDGSYIPSAGMETMSYLARPIRIPSKKIDEKDIDTKLRSFKEVIGYNVKAIDGKLGHVEDLIIDDEDWQIIYAVVDTKNWVPWGKKVLISIPRLGEISYVNKEVSINLYKDMIENAPEFTSIKTVNENYEKELVIFYKNLFDNH